MVKKNLLIKFLFKKCEKEGDAMSKNKIEKFKEERERLNNIVMKFASLKIKRFFSLDSQAYRQGSIPVKYKELMGLVASLVLRCDDCITYHVYRCFEEGITTEEFEEAVNIALVVGGSIVIPHLRRAFESWDILTSEKK